MIACGAGRIVWASKVLAEELYSRVDNREENLLAALPAKTLTRAKPIPPAKQVSRGKSLSRDS